MSERPDKPQAGGPRAGTILAAAAMVAGLTAASEGLVRVARPDPVGIPTACYGHTGGVTNGRAYSDDECLSLLVQDLAKHGAAIDRCLPAATPLPARAAFTDFAFNAGPAAFCGSSMARKAQAHDLAGACAELSRWVYAGGRPLPGLVARRAKERALCEQGLVAAAPPPAPTAATVPQPKASRPSWVFRFLARFA